MKELNIFLDTYQQLDHNTLSLLTTIYEDEVTFVDPVHTVHGLGNLQKYFAGLYENVEDISFVFGHKVVAENHACVQWRMHFTHRKLASGRPVVVDGISVLKFSEHGKVDHHRDYFDVGNMVYEHIPVVGRIIRYLKEKISA
ncbi:MAG TPA: nuclear transport factor 2 family protein [Desulfopila sp.]|nr:nuclear transport factor 2 family protein [Desulfopila sp.]